MHLLLVLLQQLLGMLPSAKQAPQGEVVRTRQPNDSRSEPDAFQRLGLSQDGWMTTLPGCLCAEDCPPIARAVGRPADSPAPFSPLHSSDARTSGRAGEAALFGRNRLRPVHLSGDHPEQTS